jgi:TolB-like protein/Tfp pilus assembly protein PilF
MGLVSELRRRNVLRMAAVYLVAAWLVMQVAEVVVGLANLPPWIGPAVLGLLTVGFPIALVFSWFYELTPEGLSLEKDVDPDPSITRITGRRIDIIIISLLCAAVILLAYDKWSTGIPADQSIAVLPFESISPGDESAAFLAVGIQDDLLTRLSRLGDFKVISRTSVERYRNAAKRIPIIGAELGVSRILEGGVQREGDKIRVNVQLINAATDEHVWAETYDRQLGKNSVLAIQSDIVEAIVSQLHVNPTPQETRELAAMPTKNLAAYTAYLDGKYKSDVESVVSLNAAIESFQTAVNLDPGFALAYVGLADAYLTLSANFWGGLPAEKSIALAEPPLVRAFDLDDSLGEAHATLGLLRQEQGDVEAAERAFEKSIALSPNYSRALRLYGRLRWRQGRNAEAMELMQSALRLDPYSAPVNYDVARLYDESGSFDEALNRYLRVIEIAPDHAFAYVYIAALHYLVFGRADESLVWYQRAADNDALSPSLQSAQALAYLELGDPDSAGFWVERGRELGRDTFWAIWASLLLNVYTGDDAAARADARTMLEKYPKNWGALHVLSNFDLAAGRYEVARARFARVFRELTEPEIPVVDSSNFRSAVDLALVLLHLDEQERANDLLEGSLAVIATMPRLGTHGYDILDVRIFALQQRPEHALDALQRAIDDGWRFLSWFYLEHDLGLDSIRDEPEFQRLYARVKADLAAQARHVEELRESGELASPGRLDH